MFYNYDQVLPEMLTNNGHTGMRFQLLKNYPRMLKFCFETNAVMMSVKSQSNEDVPFITEGGLTDPYKFFQLHFHWGRDVLSGSEHTINGQP